VAVATLRLIASELTGQVLDVRRHDAHGAPPAEEAEADARAAEPAASPGRATSTESATPAVGDPARSR
jgi:hypothetical protein